MSKNGDSRSTHSKYRYIPQGTWKDPQIGTARNRCTCKSWIGSATFRQHQKEHPKSDKD